MSTDVKTVKLKLDPWLLLFLVFFALKLADVIDWSWWWITAPLWAPLGLACGIFAGLVLAAAIWRD